MTSTELQMIEEAFRPLYLFLRKTHHDEDWHATRNQIWTQATQRISALVVDEKPKVPEKNIEGTEQESVELEQQKAELNGQKPDG